MKRKTRVPSVFIVYRWFDGGEGVGNKTVSMFWIRGHDGMDDRVDGWWCLASREWSAIIIMYKYFL